MKRHTDDVAPPFAIDGLVPMEDDPSNSNSGEQDWTPEEDCAETRGDKELSPPDSSSEEPPKIVSLFA